MTPPPDWLEAAKALLATVTKGDGGECWENSDERGTLHSVGYIPIPADDCPACRLRAVIRDEEARRLATPARALPKGWACAGSEWSTRWLLAFVCRDELWIRIKDHPEDQTLPPEVLAQALEEMGWTCEPPEKEEA